MQDLLPLFAYVVGLLISGATIWALLRPRIRRNRGRRIAFSALVTTLSIAAPYLAFTLLRGNPDVWDFYRSVALVPAISIGLLGIYSLYAAGLPSGNRNSVASDRSPG